MPWIFAEDAALKKTLSGLTVTDVNAPDGRPVGVRFRLPETELADLVYPVLIIEHASILRDSEREHRGIIQLPYAPEGLPLWDDPGLADGMLDPRLSPYTSEFPVPYTIDYAVTLMARRSAHLVDLIGQLAAHDRLPARFGALEIPEDGTVRRVEITGGPDFAENKDADGKRLFTAAYRVRIPTELAPEPIQTYQKVLSVVGGIVDRETAAELEQFWSTYDGNPPGLS